MTRTALERFRSTFFANAAMFKKTYLDVEVEFGPSWADEFDLHLANVFGDDDDAYRDAVRGYSRFAIDAMRLQTLFKDVELVGTTECTYCMSWRNGMPIYLARGPIRPPSSGWRQLRHYE